MKIFVQLGLIAGLYFLIPFSMATGITINKYLAYFLVFLISVLNVLFFRKSTLQVLVLFVFAIIVQSTLIYRMYIAGYIVVDVGGLFILFSYLSNIAMGSHTKVPNTAKLFITVFLFLSLASTSIAFINGADLKSELIAIQIYVLFAIAFMLFGIQIRQLPNFSQMKLERIFSIITICVSFLYMFAIFTGVNIEDVRSGGQVSKTSATYFRYGGVFSNVNVQSAFLTGGMIYGMFLYIRKSSTLDKLLGSLAFTMGMTANIMSGSRMALICLVLLVLMFLVYQRKRIKEVAHFLIGVGFAIMILAAQNASKILTMFNRSYRRIDEKGGSDQRIDIWSCALESIQENLLGMGVSTDIFSSYMDQCLGNVLGNPHNTFLGVIVHLGIPGAIFISVCTFFLIKTTLRLLLQAKTNEYVANIFFLSVVLFFGMTEAFIFTLHKLHFIYFFVIGLVLGGPIFKVYISSNLKQNNLKKSLANE